MADANDMTIPVTRGELREELGQLEQRFDQKLERLEQRLDERFDKFEQRLKRELMQEFATKRELELWGGALLAHIDRVEHRLSAELARHAGAIQESMSALFAARDEQYADLPGRVSRLEAAVFPSDVR